MAQTKNEYTSYASVLRTSRSLVSRLQQRDWTDRILLFLGLSFFLLVVFHIVRQRIYIPGWDWIFTSSSSSSSSISQNSLKDHHHHHDDDYF